MRCLRVSGLRVVSAGVKGDGMAGCLPARPREWRPECTEYPIFRVSIFLLLLPPLRPLGDLPQAAPLILTYGYYWYNFMPLARGTAACGYTTILSLFWAAGMPVTASIPKDYQARVPVAFNRSCSHP